MTASGADTEVEAEAPSLTTRERDVLVALCRPLLDRDMFTEPASTRAIADELAITQAAVKQHLPNNPPLPWAVVKVRKTLPDRHPMSPRRPMVLGVRLSDHRC